MAGSGEAAKRDVSPRVWCRRRYTSTDESSDEIADTGTVEGKGQGGSQNKFEKRLEGLVEEAVWHLVQGGW
jgi:hypothetical protein